MQPLIVFYMNCSFVFYFILFMVNNNRITGMITLWGIDGTLGACFNLHYQSISVFEIQCLK